VSIQNLESGQTREGLHGGDDEARAIVKSHGFEHIVIVRQHQALDGIDGRTDAIVAKGSFDAPPACQPERLVRMLRCRREEDSRAISLHAGGLEGIAIRIVVT
jgi:hypothetical protein